MTWIESHDTLAQHPKTRRACRILSIAAPQMIGHLHLLWWWAMSYADDGDLGDFDERDIADAAQWDGDPALFVEALTDCGPGESPGFLDRDPDTGRLMIHDWDEYAGKLVERRRANAERMREKRATHVQRTSEVRAEQVQGYRTNPTVPTVPNLTNEESAAAANAAPRPPTDDRLIWDAFEESLCIAPATKSERGKWNQGIRQLRDAGVTVQDIPRLVRAYRDRYGEIDCNPMALAANLSAVQSARASPNGNGVRHEPVDLTPIVDLAKELKTGKFRG